MKFILFKLYSVNFISIAILLTIVNSASAHRVNVFAWVDGNTVQVESKFSGGKKVKAGKVMVMDPKGVELLSGLTNDQGEFSFKVPKLSDLRIIVVAGQGHQGEWKVRETELQELTSETTSKFGGSNTVSSGQVSDVGNPSGDSDAAESGRDVNLEELEAIVEKVLDRKLQPVTRMLADIRQEGPDVGDIIAGIGYILGLVGIAAYVQNRKKKT